MVTEQASAPVTPRSAETPSESAFETTTPTAADPTLRSGLERWLGVLRAPGPWAIFLVVTAIAAYFTNRGVLWNADTHVFLTASIVDRGSVFIDPFARYTGDIAFANGHYVADKAPGLSLFAVPFYWLIKVTLLHGQPYTAVIAAPINTRIDFYVRYLLAVVCDAMPTGLIAALLYGVFLRLGASRAWSAALALTYGLGTIARPFASLFFSHQFAACLCFSGFVILLRIRRGELKARYALAAGLLLGYSVITEAPTAIMLAMMAGYAYFAFREKWRALALLALGTLPALAIELIYNAAAFGSPLGIGYGHLAGPDEFKQGQAQGFFGLTYPHLDAIWGTTFSPYRGIFVLSPVLLLAIPGCLYLWRRQAWRAETLVCAAIGGAFFVLNWSYFAWDGGYSMGPRQVLVCLPFMMLPIGQLVTPYMRKGMRLWSSATASLAAYSIVVVELSAAIRPLFDQRFASPLTQWVLPQLAGMNVDFAHPNATQATLGSALWHSAPLFLSAHLELNWGMSLGLPGIAQLAPLALCVAVILLWPSLRAASRLIVSVVSREETTIPFLAPR
jgi:hypothetical protein